MIGGSHHETTVHMNNAFRFAGGAGRIEDEKRVLGVHVLGGTIGRGLH